jgi:hypothetical protein
VESELENIILVLLTNKIDLDVLFILYGKSLIYNRENSGPSIVNPVAIWYELCKMQYEWKAQIKVYIVNTSVC